MKEVGRFFTFIFSVFLQQYEVYRWRKLGPPSPPIFDHCSLSLIQKMLASLAWPDSQISLADHAESITMANGNFLLGIHCAVL